MWILAFSVSFSLLACSSREGEWGLLKGAPFSGSGPRLTNVGMELPTGGTACLAATCSTKKEEDKNSERDIYVYTVLCRQFHIVFNLTEMGYSSIAQANSPLRNNQSYLILWFSFLRKAYLLFSSYSNLSHFCPIHWNTSELINSFDWLLVGFSDGCALRNSETHATMLSTWNKKKSLWRRNIPKCGFISQWKMTIVLVVKWSKDRNTSNM